MLGTDPAVPVGDTTNPGTTAVGAVRTVGEAIPMHGVVPPTVTGARPTAGVLLTVSTIRGDRPLALATPGVLPLVLTTHGDGGLLMVGTVTTVPITEIRGTTVDLLITAVPTAAVPTAVAAPTTVEDLRLNPDALLPGWWLATMHLCGLP